MKTNSAQTEEIVVVDRFIQNECNEFVSEITQTVQDTQIKEQFKKYPSFYCNTNIAQVHFDHVKESERLKEPFDLFQLYKLLFI